MKNEPQGTPEGAGRVCNWHEDDPDTDMWETECGKAFVLNEGSPKENDMRFCCYCGGSLTESRTEAEEEDHGSEQSPTQSPEAK